MENKNIVLRQFSTTTTTHTRLCCWWCSRRRRRLSDWRITSNASSVVFSHFLIVHCVLKESQREEREKNAIDRSSLALRLEHFSRRATQNTTTSRARDLRRTSRAFFFECRARVFGGGQRNNNNRLFYSTSDDDDDDDDDDEMTRCVVYLRRHRRAS